MPLVNRTPSPDKTMASNYIQGPLRAVDVLDILAWEDCSARDRAMDSGRHATDAYFRAWNWLGAVILNNPRPELPWHSLQALKAGSADSGAPAGI